MSFVTRSGGALVAVMDVPWKGLPPQPPDRRHPAIVVDDVLGRGRRDHLSPRLGGADVALRLQPLEATAAFTWKPVGDPPRSRSSPTSSMALRGPTRAALVATALERGVRLRLAAADAPLRRGGAVRAIVTFVGLRGAPGELPVNAGAWTGTSPCLTGNSLSMRIATADSLKGGGCTPRCRRAAG